MKNNQSHRYFTIFKNFGCLSLVDFHVRLTYNILILTTDLQSTALKSCLTPIESRDLIGAYKRDNLEEVMITDPTKYERGWIDASQLAVDMWYEVSQLYNSVVHGGPVTQSDN